MTSPFRALRLGHGANCSSVGSAVDLLYATATAGAIVFTAVAAALASEGVTVVGRRTARDDEGRRDDGHSDHASAPPGDRT
ncbi:MAG: hypothetical protein U0169_16375 [Polyangiaceae bacterium]